MIARYRRGYPVSRTASLYPEEEIRLRWDGQTSNPVGSAMRCWVGSTPILFRQIQARVEVFFLRCAAAAFFAHAMAQAREFKPIKMTFLASRDKLWR